MGKRRGIRIGATAGMIVGLYQLYTAVKGKGGNMGPYAIQALTGYDIAAGTWNWRNASAAIPMLAGVGLSMVASKTGLNRYTPTGINI